MLVRCIVEELWLVVVVVELKTMKKGNELIVVRFVDNFFYWSDRPIGIQL